MTNASPKTSLIATLADLKARREVIQLQYDNSSWAMGGAYRDRLARIDRQIADTKDALNA